MFTYETFMFIINVVLENAFLYIYWYSLLLYVQEVKSLFKMGQDFLEIQYDRYVIKFYNLG